MEEAKKSKQSFKTKPWFQYLKSMSLEDDSILKTSKYLEDSEDDSEDIGVDLSDPLHCVLVDAIAFKRPETQESSEGSEDLSTKLENVIEPEELHANEACNVMMTYNEKALNRYATTYQLENFQKNYLMIFNQENIEGYKPRKGTEMDVQALQNTFSRYGFETVEHKDLTRDAILEELKIFNRKDFTDYGCVAVAVLTHGTNHGLLRAKDRQYNEAEIINSFKTHNKPTLITKPKLLIIQACRGTKLIPGVPVNRSSQIRKDVDDSIDAYTLPVESDMLVLHSCYMGSPSHRDELHGSWFIQSLCRKINQFAAKLDFESIMTEMKKEVAIDQFHREVNRRTGEMDTNKQMPVITSTLIRKLYLRKHGDHVTTTSSDEPSTSTAQFEIDEEPRTPMMVQFGPCSCFLDHFSYIRNCLRYFLENNPDDKTAQAYLDISNTFDEGVEFNTSKEKMAKAICDHLCKSATDFEFFKYLYLYNYRS